MANELPDSVRIGPRKYSIHWDLETWSDLEDTSDSTLGKSNSHSLDIYINPKQNVDQKADTLWHEIKHQVMAIGAGNLSNYAHMEELEEHIVSSTTPWEILIMRDNPEVIDYILEPF